MNLIACNTKSFKSLLITAFLTKDWWKEQLYYEDQ